MKNTANTTKTVLVADDDPGILEIMKIVLEEGGYTVTSIADSSTIHETIKTTLPAVVLIDITMSGANGADITKALKKDPQTKHIPVIIVSARTETETLAKQAGATDFLLKPFDIDDLLAVVKKYSTA